MSIGYLASRSAARLLKTEVNLPIIFTLSILPDIDLLFPLIEHRGPTHSIIVMIAAFVPVFAIWRRRAIPYLVAAAQHLLIGDYITGRLQLLWPLQRYFGMNIRITDPINITIETATFLAATAALIATSDIKKLFKPHNLNLVLTVPVATVLLPPLLAFPIEVPLTLVPPHIVFLMLFVLSILAYILRLLRPNTQNGERNERLPKMLSNDEPMPQTRPTEQENALYVMGGDLLLDMPRYCD